ncbi:MAG: shikimate kinase [Candidatus Marinimicrobia bacterium]|jgi:shikimate kinase|nr:shikimate kinase [Candidatus Neomarinimicrobiota bacterium]MBT4359432.1 shikimate kinase [Candidatus Neomarinimicrobiota bacterium]MBT4715962.1 shikimate kinase [Candidatus Neomarinimicrobiota bacterium]MBT4948105.1 shikimate kinase [Candidatus Neomarinimicrobiota bacterium]MBT5270987.1 shikimate kinase [Candidatus Neomarinimicrobiota bacterium]
MMSISKVYLIGLMGAGKSTVGRLLADALSWQLLDIDQEIEKFAGNDIPSIFEAQGEDGFRDYEAQVLMETASLNDAIIPCGGGIITRPENVEYLKDHLTIWLDVSPEEAAARLEHSDHRPLLNECKDTIKKLQEILDNRQVGYAEAASLHINTGQRAPDIITHEILEKLESYHV